MYAFAFTKTGLPATLTVDFLGPRVLPTIIVFPLRDGSGSCSRISITSFLPLTRPSIALLLFIGFVLRLL
jgi:hypothetical protein